MAAFVKSAAPLGAGSRTVRCARRPATIVRAEADDKVVVKEYFNTTGFERWNRIYSEDAEVNDVQMNIRTGHQQTIDTIIEWLEEDDLINGKMICDAGCGVGSLAIPLAERGATVFASDISDAMVTEARSRAQKILGPAASRAQFEAADLESLSGSYDTVCCVDVLIHYPDSKLREMVGHLLDISKDNLIFSFAPKTMFLSMLKKVGEFFPGPSKATRAYLHSEEDVRKIVEDYGFEVVRKGSTSAKFYFATILEIRRK